jgi:seryl-tRNA synthetase
MPLMLDIKLIRAQPEKVRDALASRGGGDEKMLDDVQKLDTDRRKFLTEVEALKNQRNKMSEEIGKAKARGENPTEKMAEVRKIGDKISALDKKISETESSLNEILLRIPNLPHESVPKSADPSGNVVVRQHGKKPNFSFTPKPHWEIGEALGILDFPRAAKIAGRGFILFKGAGAKLERALINFMLDLHTRPEPSGHGYAEIFPPFLINRAAMIGTGQLPKFEEDMYRLRDDELYLAPTAEVPVANLHRDEILREDQLPIRYCAYTGCFRREAGAAGKETRGMIRVHQFDKVELIKFTTPETSYDELEKMVADAEKVLQLLGLHYRVRLLCTADMGFASAKTYDIEVWAPAQNNYLEVSSISNCEDFQARRANIRYKNRDGKNQFVHILNGSGVALPRLFVAILENFQQADGSVQIPEVLIPYMDGMKEIQSV